MKTIIILAFTIVVAVSAMPSAEPESGGFGVYGSFGGFGGYGRRWKRSSEAGPQYFGGYDGYGGHGTYWKRSAEAEPQSDGGFFESVTRWFENLFAQTSDTIGSTVNQLG